MLQPTESEQSQRKILLAFVAVDGQEQARVLGDGVGQGRVGRKVERFDVRYRVEDDGFERGQRTERLVEYLGWGTGGGGVKGQILWVIGYEQGELNSAFRRKGRI